MTTMNTTDQPRAVACIRFVRRWQRGVPPKDGSKYEMRRRYRNAGGQWTTAVWGCPGWWNGKMFVARNQFTGGERWLDISHYAGQRIEWREYSPNKEAHPPSLSEVG